MANQTDLGQRGGFSSSIPPDTAKRFLVPQYDESDPVEMAVDIRDDVPGGCVIYGRFSERWHCNVSARSLVRILLGQVDIYSAPPTCGECGAEITSKVYCHECSDLLDCSIFCVTCGDHGCPDCRSGEVWS